MRTIVASVLVVAALAAVLIGWFGSGWPGVRDHQARLRAEPAQRAEARARELAAELSARLEALRASEARRPYYHYGNLFHDPRGASEGFAVAPSPLASGPGDPLIRGHFQIKVLDGGRWQVTLPTINDEIPELTTLGNLDADNVLRGELVAVAGDLAGKASPIDVAPVTVAAAGNTPTGDTPRVRPPRRATTTPPPRASTPPVQTQAPPEQAQQVIELSPEQYEQNQYANYVFNEARNRAENNPQQQRVTSQQRNVPPPARANPPPTTTAPPPAAATPAQPAKPKPRKPKPKPEPEPERVTIAVAPFEWHAAELADKPALIALRRVDTPDEELTQGLVVSAGALSEWIGEQVVGGRIEIGDTPVASSMMTAPLAIAGGWRVAIPIEGAAAAEVAAIGVGSAFWGRFVPVGVLALVCGILVVVVVARAERLARARSRFAAAAAHELRTPLAGLQLYGDMLSDGLGDPGKAQQYAHRISEEASRLGRVVANVLGFSQLERGDLAVHPRPGDAAAAARDVIERARPTLERAGMTIDVELPDELRARFDGDGVARILGNLLDNAEKYSRGLDPRRVAITGRTGDGKNVEIEVADSGPGVTVPARLFTPFARGVDSDGPAGLGLGLALSRSLARAMNGDLVHRASANGATFVLVLPQA